MTEIVDDPVKLPRYFFFLGRTLQMDFLLQDYNSVLSLFVCTGGIIQHHCSGPFYDHAIQIIGYDLTGIVHVVYIIQVQKAIEIIIDEISRDGSTKK